MTLFDYFMKQKYGEQMINDFNSEFKKDSSLTFSNFQKKQGIVTLGGNRKTTTVKKINKKTILGKERCIYAIQGDRKEYLRYKGDLIPVKDYKKLMKDKK
jgi:hypothetical protein